jgi:hypothetical protein
MQSSACAPASSAERASSTAVSGASDHRHAPRGRRHGALHDAIMFAGRQQQRLARRSARHKGGCAVIDLAMAQSFECGNIHRAVEKWRRQRHARPVRLEDLVAHGTHRYAAIASARTPPLLAVLAAMRAGGVQPK